MFICEGEMYFRLLVRTKREQGFLISCVNDHCVPASYNALTVYNWFYGLTKKQQ